MAARCRPFVMLVLLLCLIPLTGAALAQTDGPDPDSPIQIPTDAANDDDLPEVRSTKSDHATPDASPVATGEPDLAAMTLDSRVIPDAYQLIAESYTPIEELLDAMLGLVDRDELLATGILGLYQSTYVNVSDASTIRTYVISYEIVDGVQAGFDILENEELLVPNGALEDLPGLEGVGEEPSEVTTGTIELGDGTRTGSYDVTFRVDRYQAGVAMETRDGSEPPAEVVDGLAVDLAERVADVVAGNYVEQVVYGLPDQLIRFEVAASYEGYQTVEESVDIGDPRFPLFSYMGGYYRAASFSDSVSLLPYVTMGVNQFDSPAIARDVFLNPTSMLPPFDSSEPIRNIKNFGADNARAYEFSSPQGAGSPDSVRLFLLIEDQVILIDVQGMESLDAAQATAFGLAELQVDCTINRNCETSGGIT